MVIKKRKNSNFFHHYKKIFSPNLKKNMLVLMHILDSHVQKIVDPCVMVIFGATGDLTQKRLFPALYNLSFEGLLPLNFACLSFARKEKTDAFFREEIKQTSLTGQCASCVDAFLQKIFYLQANFDNDDGYVHLKEQLSLFDKKFGTKQNRLFYLATPPKYFATIVEKLYFHKLLYSHHENLQRWSRVIIEKPFGHDLLSAQTLQNILLKYLSEKQIFRIDHYLGKETVQNIFAIRFANPLFESIWNHNHIDHVQITVAEDSGIGGRGTFFEETGILRDVMQNHMMQLLSLIAMEPPQNFSSSKVREAKVNLLKSIRPIKKQDVIRGQYDRGFIQGNPVLGYREELNISKTSSVETYGAIKLHIDNDRWKNVPFYLRAGKRLPKKISEIAIVFKDSPSCRFLKNSNNVLAISIQPQESIALKINCKVPFDAAITQPVKMEFSYKDHFGLVTIEAYAKLIHECMLDNHTLFISDKETLYSWKIFSPIISMWNNTKANDFPNYQAGSWGPKDKLLGNKKWRLL